MSTSILMKVVAFERRNQKLADRSVFITRVASSLALGMALLCLALFIGVAGYHWIAGLDWIDSLLEASMILGGMGPISPLHTSGAKVFASAYALFSGVIFIAMMGIVLAPIAHRMLHSFHLDDRDSESKKR